MRFDVVTLFPSLFDSFLKESLIGKALEKGLFEVGLVDIRDFTHDRHRTADDRPFGGGPGMVLKVGPLTAAIEHAKEQSPSGQSLTALMSPSGRRLDQTRVEELAELDHLILVCGRYEGVDQRIEPLIDEEISIGDYVLSGGEMPAMVIIEAAARLLPGVMGKAESAEEETFASGLLEYPHYTRPREFRGVFAPEVLLSGDHAAVKAWRLKESLRKTLRRRPDLLSAADLDDAAKKALAEIRKEET